MGLNSLRCVWFVSQLSHCRDLYSIFSGAAVPYNHLYSVSVSKCAVAQHEHLEMDEHDTALRIMQAWHVQARL